ncbi:hypothetical protein MKW94_002765, partial [Papaver nudicaule]|nr:hypothetical protein [Papaver nudicaule]
MDNNNLSGYLPPEFSETTSLRILQLDNNRFDEAEIPASYGSKNLLKLSLRNCSLRGVIPDLSGSPEIFVVDLSWNQLTGSLPLSKLSGNMTTIDLSNNNLSGSIPASFSELPNLQRLSLWNNSLSGSVPSTLWRNTNLGSVAELMLDLRSNLFSNISGDINPPKNVTLRLQENPLCNKANTNLVQFCEAVADDDDTRRNLTISSPNCVVRKCPADYYFVYAPLSSPGQCFCAAPFSIAYRLKSPSFSYFGPYESSFIEYMAENLKLETSQILVFSYGWDEGPRLWMNLTLFLLFDNSSIKINRTEVRRIKRTFTTWSFPQSNTFGPYDLLDYPDRHFHDSSEVWLSKGALAGLILGIIALSSLVTAIIAIIIVRTHYNSFDSRPRKHLFARISLKVDDLNSFTLKELLQATENFNSLVIGEGGYGKVYRGVLTDQTIVAVKRAQFGSLQGEKEFLTEIEFLSRLHHRNLVGLLGYCDEEGEQ